MLYQILVGIVFVFATVGCGDAGDPPSLTESDAAVRDNGDAARAPVDAARAESDAAAKPDLGTADASAGGDAGAQSRDAGLYRPINSFEPVSSLTKTASSSIDLCWGDCPEKECDWGDECEGRYDDALEPTYDYCPAGIESYCLQVCEKNSVGECDIFKPRTRSYLIDCTTGTTSIYRCGITDGCWSNENLVTCL